MQINVMVKPGRSKEFVQEVGSGSFVVSLKARPIEGKANKALQKILAKYFGVSSSCVVIEKGKASRIKKVEVIL